MAAQRPHRPAARDLRLTALIQVGTQLHRELVDVTAQVRAAVATSGVREGLCCVSVPHTTAGVTVNENSDPDVAADLLRWAQDTLGDEHRYKHWERNAGGHILSSLFGCSTTLPVEHGDLALGQWQAVYLVEGDGPRQRTVRVTLVPSS